MGRSVCCSAEYLSCRLPCELQTVLSLVEVPMETTNEAPHRYFYRSVCERTRGCNHVLSMKYAVNKASVNKVSSQLFQERRQRHPSLRPSCCVGCVQPWRGQQRRCARVLVGGHLARMPIIYNLSEMAQHGLALLKSGQAQAWAQALTTSSARGVNSPGGRAGSVGSVEGVGAESSSGDSRSDMAYAR